MIAGTETYSKETLKQLPNLKIISRLGVGLDVFEEEPYSGALLNYENVTVTPHVGDDLFNNITEEKINHLFTNNIIKYFISHNN